MTNPSRGVTKAVTPAAGTGTRFLPATKAVPEGLPVLDRPAIQYVVEEAVAAGLDDVLMITGPGKGALEDHFDRQWEVEQALEAKADAARPQQVQHSSDLVLDPLVFAVLHDTPPVRGNEVRLTDALQTLAASDQPGGGVRGVVFRGRRYDTGDRLDYLKAAVQLGSEHEELGEDLSTWLAQWAAARP